jgi:hypothetical protein
MRSVTSKLNACCSLQSVRTNTPGPLRNTGCYDYSVHTSSTVEAVLEEIESEFIKTNLERLSWIMYIDVSLDTQYPLLFAGTHAVRSDGETS